MSIKGLTDRGLSFPEIGQIRKGAKKTGNAPGADLQYFRVEFDERENKAAEMFAEQYKGGKPSAIRIILPFNEIERVWDAWLEAYTAGRMVARSDGEKFLYLIDTETNKPLVLNGIDLETGRPRPYIDGQPVGYYTDRNGKQQPIMCKPSGRLKVIIPELMRAAYLTVLTTSKFDIINISDQLRAFAMVNNGRIAGIPFIIRRRPKKISCPNADGTRARREKWLISIEADPEWVGKVWQEMHRLALPGGDAPALPSGAPEDEYTDSDEREFDDGELEGEDVQDGEFATEPPTSQPPDEETDAPADEKAWREWGRLIDKALVLGLTIQDVPNGATLAQLRAAYASLREEIKQAEPK